MQGKPIDDKPLKLWLPAKMVTESSEFQALEQGARGAKPEMVRGATGAASKAQGADLAKVP